MVNVRYQESPVMSTNKYASFKGPHIVTRGRLKVRGQEICAAPFTDPVRVKKSMKFQTLIKRTLVRACHCRKMRLSLPSFIEIGQKIEDVCIKIDEIPRVKYSLIVILTKEVSK
jgi:hypothetical protein